jgi:hypothetical protein
MIKPSPITYFEREGRANLQDVIKALKKTLAARPELQSKKIVFFTAIGEGPALAYNHLIQFRPKIIAITFSPQFYFTHNDEKIHPKISDDLEAFFRGVGIPVITSRLPFDSITGLDAHNKQCELVREVLSMVGGGLALCVQAVLQACDHGLVEPGELVFGVSGDFAVLVSAAPTSKFLSKDGGLAVHEIICKPRNLTIARRGAAPVVIEQSLPLFKNSAPVPRLKGKNDPDTKQ